MKMQTKLHYFYEGKGHSAGCYVPLYEWAYWWWELPSGEMSPVFGINQFCWYEKSRKFVRCEIDEEICSKPYKGLQESGPPLPRGWNMKDPRSMGVPKHVRVIMYDSFDDFQYTHARIGMGDRMPFYYKEWRL